MGKLKQNNNIIVYHDIKKDNVHFYYFYDGSKKEFLDWGETDLVPNIDDRFLYREKDIDLRLKAILWAKDNQK